MKIISKLAMLAAGAFALSHSAFAYGVNLHGTCYEPQGDGTTWAASCNNDNVVCDDNYGACVIMAVAGPNGQPGPLVSTPTDIDYSTMSRADKDKLSQVGSEIMRKLNARDYAKLSKAPCVNPFEPCGTSWPDPMSQTKSASMGGANADVSDADIPMCPNCVFIFKRIEPPVQNSQLEIEDIPDGELILPSAGPGGTTQSTVGSVRAVRKEINKRPAVKEEAKKDRIPQFLTHRDRKQD